ncbi:MAG TPA: type VI secretion system protein TssA [Lautropia sp.]|nr:type VI secretion system protein TssA [Lautropia sp.]
MDFESLTLAVSEESPCGDSLDYDPAYAELEIVARGKPEQHFGKTLVPAQEPDWRQVQTRSLELMRRTRDLRVAVLLARAQTVLEGLPGLTASLELIRQLLIIHWEQVHPQLDSDDPNDAMVRMNALAALVDSGGLLRDLRGAAFVQPPGSSPCRIRDVELVLGIARQAEEQPPPMTRAQLTSLVRAHAAAGGRNEAQRAYETAGALRSVLIEKVGSSQALDLGPLLQKLRPLAAFHAESVGESSPMLGEPGGSTESLAASLNQEQGMSSDGRGGLGAGADAAPGNSAGVNGGFRSGEIRSRDDAIRELDRVCAYLERHEPANPAPLLIRRSQRLLKMNFIDILRDLAPEGMSSIEKIAGSPPAE